MDAEKICEWGAFEIAKEIILQVACPFWFSYETLYYRNAVPE